MGEHGPCWRIETWNNLNVVPKKYSGSLGRYLLIPSWTKINYFGEIFYSILQTKGKLLNYHGPGTVLFWHISAEAVVKVSIFHSRVLTWKKASVLHQPPLQISVAGCTLSNGFPANVSSVAAGLRGVMADTKLSLLIRPSPGLRFAAQVPPCQIQPMKLEGGYQNSALSVSHLSAAVG